MAKRKKKRRARDKRMSVLTLAGLGIATMPAIQNAAEGHYEAALAELGARFTGYNFQSKAFNLQYALINGYLPVVLGAMGSKVATKVGANRAIKNVPFIGKYVKL